MYPSSFNYDFYSFREFDILLIWSTDRLSRAGTEDLMSLWFRLDKSGVKVHSYLERYTDQISDDNLLPYCYEDLYARETETREKNLETICDFVGIERSYLHEEMVQEKFLTKLEKNRKDKYKQIKNYEEVMNLKNEM